MLRLSPHNRPLDLQIRAATIQDCTHANHMTPTPGLEPGPHLFIYLPIYLEMFL